MTMTKLLGDYVDSTEIARILGVSLSAVSNYKRRHSDFPKPIVLAGHKFYLRDDVIAWGRNREVSYGGKRVPKVTTMKKLLSRMTEKERQEIKEWL